MKKNIFTGACTALITPFTESGIDYESFSKLINFQIDEGIDALLVCGTTGEASTMPDSEHMDAIKFAVDVVNKRVPVIAGTGSNDTRHAIKLTKEAEALGADAILTVSPYYNKTTQEGLYQHFKAIADSVKIPVMLYNIPTRTGVNINPETLKRLACIDNIVAVKECNIGQLAEVKKLCPCDFDIYTGNDDQVVYNLAMGGKGVISVLSNIAPKYVHDMVYSFIGGDIDKCRKMQLDALGLINALFCEVNPIPAKAAACMMGFCENYLRSPLVQMSENNSAILRKEMEAFGLI